MEKEEKTDLVKKTWIIQFNSEATIEDVIAVLNSTGLATKDYEVVQKFRGLKGIELKEVGILG